MRKKNGKRVEKNDPKSLKATTFVGPFDAKSHCVKI